MKHHNAGLNSSNITGTLSSNSEPYSGTALMHIYVCIYKKYEH